MLVRVLLGLSTVLLLSSCLPNGNLDPSFFAETSPGYYGGSGNYYYNSYDTYDSDYYENRRLKHKVDKLNHELDHERYQNASLEQQQRQQQRQQEQWRQQQAQAQAQKAAEDAGNQKRWREQAAARNKAEREHQESSNNGRRR